MNAAGTQRNIETMIHEAGHAFHSFYSGHLDLIHERDSPIEFAEVASNVNGTSNPSSLGRIL